jgi:hypothetical protein
MAYTYSKIATYTVGSGGVANISFLNIPQTYTDLILKVSGRGSNSGQVYEYANVTFNGVTSGYSGRNAQGDGTSAVANNYTSNIYLMLDGSTATASTFGNGELMIPNYTSENLKSVSMDSVMENNATLSYSEITASIWSRTAPITSITLTPLLGTTWAQHTTAHLYGIKAEL